MTNKLENALEQVGNVFIQMSIEIKELKAEIADLQIMVHKHESTNSKLAKVFREDNY